MFFFFLFVRCRHQKLQCSVVECSVSVVHKVCSYLVVRVWLYVAFCVEYCLGCVYVACSCAVCMWSVLWAVCMWSVVCADIY